MLNMSKGKPIDREPVRGQGNLRVLARFRSVATRWEKPYGIIVVSPAGVVWWRAVRVGCVERQGGARLAPCPVHANYPQPQHSKMCERAYERVGEWASGRREQEIAVTADESRRLRRGAARFWRLFAATRPTRPTHPTNLTSERADERAVESRGRVERAEVWERACAHAAARKCASQVDRGSRGAVTWPQDARLIISQQWDEQRSAHRRDMVMCWRLGR